MEKDFDRGNGEKKKRALNVWHRSEDTCLLLDAMPSVGPALATALVATVADPKAFRPGRDFSAWIGLVPKHRLVRQRELGEDPRSGIGLDRGGTTPWNPLERQIVQPRTTLLKCNIFRTPVGSANHINRRILLHFFVSNRFGFWHATLADTRTAPTITRA
jgi:hypothetical protein